MLLSLQNVSFFFGARPILIEANWQIGTGERIGLVGANGAGKSTLLRLMTGAYTPDEGSINKPKDVSLGFFNQDLLSFSTNDSILKVGMQAFEKAHEIEKEMGQVLRLRSFSYLLNGLGTNLSTVMFTNNDAYIIFSRP